MSGGPACPFPRWEGVQAHIPPSYYMSEDGLWDYSWFSAAPKYSTFRVNTSKHCTKAVMEIFYQQYSNEAKTRGADPPSIHVHPSLPECIVIGPWRTLTRDCPDETLGEVIVDVPCANAVLRGADVYAPGILGLLPSAKTDDEVNIFADIDHGCRRGFLRKFEGNKSYVGRGILKKDRNALFKNNADPKGIGVEVTENLSGAPRINLPRHFGILQNLPSIVCGHLFSQVTNDVLDMCAAPGNKTTHIASLLGDKGKVIAVDKTPSKVTRLKGLCTEMGLTNVSCHVFDSTHCVLKEGSAVDGTGPPFPPGSFQAVLLDPPCSGLGQRPALANPITPTQLASYPPLQRKLFNSGVEVLKTGGMLVYSTCTITAEENEDMVAWALEKYPNLRLQPIDPPLGRPGLDTGALSEENRLLVKRFGSLQPTNSDEDTIGFFIAKFVKK